MKQSQPEQSRSAINKPSATHKALKVFNSFMGLEGNRTSHREKIISGLGGFTGILLILLITRQFVDPNAAGLIAASMGASAVLVFAVPHGPLSQPWALLGGHLVSAVIGVTCYQYIPDVFVAAACAVGLAITAMYYLRCIHPPGGATALTAVIADASLHSLGYWYVLTPVLINVLIIFAVALGFNYLFSWRRYPAVLMQYGRNVDTQKTQQEDQLSYDDLEYALRQLNLYTDVSHEDLERIYQLARNRAGGALNAQQIQLGHYYSNGEYGDNWSVRQVVDESDGSRPGQNQIIYKVVAGKDRRGSGTLSRNEFVRWSKHEVQLNENSWQRVIPLISGSHKPGAQPGNK